MMSDENRDALRSLSGWNAALALPIAVLSAYLLQRSMEVVAYWTDPFSTGTQYNQWGFAFSYLTMSLAWPLVLAVLCAFFNASQRKLHFVLANFKSSGAGPTAEDLAILAPILPLPGHLILPISARLAAGAPFATLLAVAASHALAYHRLVSHPDIGMQVGFDGNTVIGPTWATIHILMQLAAVAASLSAGWRFRQSVKDFLLWHRLL